jgi:hypothetical protein
MAKETCGLLLLFVGGTCFLIYVIQMMRYLMPGLAFGGRPEAGNTSRQNLVHEVRGTGPLLATVSCSGQVGGLTVNGPLLTADIHPGGIVISPLIDTSAIKVDQIKEFKYERGFWGRGLRIDHTSRAIANPILLRGIKEDSQFARTLRTIVDKE